MLRRLTLPHPSVVERNADPASRASARDFTYRSLDAYIRAQSVIDAAREETRAKNSNKRNMFCVDFVCLVSQKTNIGESREG
jgi:hypothetical protein